MKTALVTGGGRRLGRAMAKELAALGFAVALHARRSSAEARALAAEIAASGGRADVVVADLEEDGAATAMVETAAAMFGGLDVLINNAGLFQDDRVGALDLAALRRMQKIGLEAPLAATAAFVATKPSAAGADEPRLVVNMIDQRVLNPTARFLSYTATKAALWAATQVMARDLAPAIRAVGIGPGVILGDEGATKESSERARGRAPLGGGSLEDLRRTLRWLVATPSITGQLICIDGGLHMGWAIPERR